jgi:hypothetical protein
MTQVNTLSSIALGLLLFACGGEEAADGQDASASADSGADLADAGADDADDSNDAPDADLGPDAGPANGSECTDPEDCASGVCSNIPFLGGQCGECQADDECSSGGCSLHSPYDTVGSACNTGAAGEGCETGDVCQDGLSCGTVLSLIGLIEVSTCGACESDDDCMDEVAPNCTPIFDTTTFTGQNYCLAGNSLSLNEFCDFEGNGDVHCASNQCSIVDASGIAEVGACGECNLQNDDGCEDGETCVAGSYDLMGTGALTGSTCQ